MDAREVANELIRSALNEQGKLATPYVACTHPTVLLGKFVRRRRLELGMGTIEFAKLIGVSRPALHQIEKGEAWPRRERLQKIADAMQIPVGRLIDPVYGFLDSELQEVYDKVGASLLAMACKRKGVSP